jgi:tetratricopeptide (TPR) repeat protein
LALQCVGKAPRPDDADWLVSLYDDAMPFDCRANIAAALGSLGGKSIQRTLEGWIEREPYYFVRHSLKASLSRSLQNQWQERIDAILGDIRPKSVEDAIAALSSLAEEGSRAVIVGQPERHMIGQVHFHLGTLCDEAGRSTDDKVTHFRKAISLANEDSYLLASALNSLAYSIAIERGDLTEAETAVQKALMIVSTHSRNGGVFDDTHMLDTKAVVLFRQGKFREAKEMAAQCASRPSGQTLEIYDHLGDIMAALDNPTEAKQARGKAISLASDSQQDQRLVDQIRKKLLP